MVGIGNHHGYGPSGVSYETHSHGEGHLERDDLGGVVDVDSITHGFTGLIADTPSFASALRRRSKTLA